MKLDVGKFMHVGIRELRDNLSRRLDDVRAGRTITVTDHGRPIAKLVPMQETSTFDRLVSEGRIIPAESHERSLPSRVVTAGPVSDFIAEQRG